MNDLLKVREEIVHELLTTKCDPMADDIVFGIQRGYHKGLLKVKGIIDDYIEKELENMASEAAGN